MTRVFSINIHKVGLDGAQGCRAVAFYQYMYKHFIIMTAQPHKGIRSGSKFEKLSEKEVSRSQELCGNKISSLIPMDSSKTIQGIIPQRKLPDLCLFPHFLHLLRTGLNVCFYEINLISITKFRNITS